MDRVKIQEIAVEAGASNAVLIEKAKELGYTVQNANSTVTVDEAGILVDYVINGVKPKSAEKPKMKVVKRANVEEKKSTKEQENPAVKKVIKKTKRGSITISPKKRKIEIVEVVPAFKVEEPILEVVDESKTEEILKDFKCKYWLIPSNPEDFDAIEELKKGTVWWSNKLNNMQINDIVYVYISKPVQKISIKSKIVDIDEDKKIFCLELIEFLTSDKLSYSNLLKKGLTIQGKSEIKNLSLLQYIQELSLIHI